MSILFDNNNSLDKQFDVNVILINSIDEQIEQLYKDGKATQINIYPLLEKKSKLEDQCYLISERLQFN